MFTWAAIIAVCLTAWWLLLTVAFPAALGFVLDVAGLMDPPAAVVQCVEEDGSGAGQSFPCEWDGTRRGNGVGSSYILTEPANPPEKFDVRGDRASR